MIILVTGGGASGKSEIGERVCCKLSEEKKAYIATMYKHDDECLQRIKKHRSNRRGKKFYTIEKYTNIQNTNISSFDTAIIECMSNLVANEMFMNDKINNENIANHIVYGIKKLYKQVNNIVIISNEIFSDGTIYDDEMLQYINQMGKLNCMLSSLSDVVIEAVVGIPVILKGNFNL